MAAFIAGAVAIWYMTAGILYVIAGVKIIRANPFWEKMLVVSSGVHSVVALVLIGPVIFTLIVGWRFFAMAAVGVVFAMAFLAIHLIAFGQMAYLARKVLREN